MTEPTKEIVSLIEDARAALVAGIVSQRERILAAFVAQHGFHPDEAVQVVQSTDTGVRWWIERKSPDDRIVSDS